MAIIETEVPADSSPLNALYSMDALGETHVQRMIQRYCELSLPELFDVLSAFAPIIASARIHTYLPVLFEGRLRERQHEKKQLNGGCFPKNATVFDASLLTSHLQLAQELSE
jgi:hypothetical protein